MSEAEKTMAVTDIKDLELQIAKARRANALAAIAVIEGDRGQAAIAALTSALDVFQGEAYTALVETLSAAAADLDPDNPVYGTITNLQSVLAASAEQGNILNALNTIKQGVQFAKPALETLERKISGKGTGLPGRPAF